MPGYNHNKSYAGFVKRRKFAKNRAPRAAQKNTVSSCVPVRLLRGNGVKL